MTIATMEELLVGVFNSDLIRSITSNLEKIDRQIGTKEAADIICRYALSGTGGVYRFAFELKRALKIEQDYETLYHLKKFLRELEGHL